MEMKTKQNKTHMELKLLVRQYKSQKNMGEQ